MIAASQAEGFDAVVLMRAESLTPLTLPVIIPAVRGRYARSRRRVSPGEGIPCWDERET